MLIDIKSAFHRIPESERKKFLEHVISGVVGASKPVAELESKLMSDGCDSLTAGAEFLSETIASLTTAIKLYSVGFDNNEALKIYLYCVINVTLIFMAEKGILGHDDIALLGSVFALVDLEVVDRLLATWEKENAADVAVNDLKSKISILNTILDEIGKPFPENPK